MSKTIGTSTVKRGRGYQGLDAYKVHNPDGDNMPPGRTIVVFPEHEEAPIWRAILAGVQSDGSAYVVPLVGHFGELQVRKLTNAKNLGLARDEPYAGNAYSRGDECDWAAAKLIALSVAHAFSLTGVTWTA